MLPFLPALRLAEALETTRIHSVAGRTGARTAVVTTRPFRAPHHTISDVGLIGGGQVPLPGEVSLAHHGVRFLDAWPECRRHVLEVLRQPLEDGVVTIARAGVSYLVFKARVSHEAPPNSTRIAKATSRLRSIEYRLSLFNEVVLGLDHGIFAFYAHLLGA
jgi:magnesium chelatase family protein